MKKIIGIDFDGTCVTDLYPYVGDNIGAASVLRELGDKNLLILYTVRDGKYLQDAVDWFRYNHINLYSVNYNPEPVSSSPKLYCDYYIDDRNIGTPLTDKGYFLTTPPLDKGRYGRMRDRRMTKSIFPSRIIIRRSYSQKVLSVD